MDIPIFTQALTRRFGERVAVDELDFRVESGQFVALLGPNGGGKSTTFRMLSTLLEPSSGKAEVFGNDVVTQQDAVRQCIGVVFQKPSLDEKLRVIDNLRYAGQLYGLRGRALKQRIELLLERFDLSDRAKDSVKTLSGGLQRRVEVAKGMIHSPKLLLLDEPSTGLDPAARSELRNNLERARDEEGVTVVMTTHILDEAEHCDSVTILHHGKAIASASPESLRAEIQGDVLRVDAEDAPSLLAELEKELQVSAKIFRGSIHIATKDAYGLAKRLHEGWSEKIQGVAITRASLEDVFLTKTGHSFHHVEKSGEAAR
ncbi:MAG: hypothetical protein CSA62_11320 [Planctomycetota bacterium]|nr:MAG: hypothetical protein CSA62_11320 [Planctomycetota bacterium]